MQAQFVGNSTGAPPDPLAPPMPPVAVPTSAMPMLDAVSVAGSSGVQAAAKAIDKARAGKNRIKRRSYKELPATTTCSFS